MTNQPHISLLFDGGCPLCKREAAYMTKLDRGRGRIELVDIAAPDFDPSPYDRTLDELMKAMHGRLSDGTLISGVPVFREAYSALGRGWMLAWTTWPGFSWLADKLYILFARIRYRHRLRDEDCPTGRCAVRFGGEAATGADNADDRNKTAPESVRQV